MTTRDTIPLTLTELDEELKAEGIELIVHRVSYDYDDHMYSHSMYVTLHSSARVTNVETDGDGEPVTDAYTRAMAVLDNKGT